MQKEGIFISQFENTFIIYRANLHLPEHYKQALRQAVGNKVQEDELEELAKKNLEAYEI